MWLKTCTLVGRSLVRIIPANYLFEMLHVTTWQESTPRLHEPANLEEADGMLKHALSPEESWAAIRNKCTALPLPYLFPALSSQVGVSRLRVIPNAREAAVPKWYTKGGCV